MDSVLIFFTDLIKGFTQSKRFLLTPINVWFNKQKPTQVLIVWVSCASYMCMYVLLGVWSCWFYSCEIERDRHYAKWKKAVKRTMKWEVNDDEDQGKKIWSNSIYHHNCMFVFTLVCLLRYCTLTWIRQQTLQGGYFGWPLLVGG